jgi:hypothetical protein
MLCYSIQQMIAPPYEMNVLQVVPPAFPYNLMQISNIHFTSHLDYDALRAFLEDGFNKASLDHAPNIDSLFGYECTGICNFHMFTCDVTIFSEYLYEQGNYKNGFIVEIRHLQGHYGAYESGIKQLLSILDVKLTEPVETFRRLPVLPIDEEYDRTFDVENINKIYSLLNESASNIDYAVRLIGEYISEPTKAYLFINDNIGIKLVIRVAQLCVEYPDSIIPINAMLIFKEFINIKETDDDIIRDVIMVCIPTCINNIGQHLHRETLGTIAAICMRNIRLMDYFKKPINGIQCYYTHLQTIIRDEVRARDVLTAIYATQILMFI